MTHKANALKKKVRKDSGHYVSPNGVRYLSRKEQKEKMKGWNKVAVSHGTKDSRFKAGTFGSDTTEKEKRDHQDRFGRAWND